MRAVICAALLALAASAAIGKYELLQYNPVAASDAVVTVTNARFTVLTSRLIRMEYSTTGSFEDRATLAFVNRNLAVPPFTQSTNNGVLTISTADVTLTYTIGAAFASNTLSIASNSGGGAFSGWAYGQPDTGNLLGTIRSLDMLGVVSLNCTENAWISVHNEELHCEWGVVSRDGWAVVNDTSNYALTDGQEWWDGVNADTEDLYFFGYGHDYKSALLDFTHVAGSIAMVPRYAAGVWWTRWYDLNSGDVKQLVRDYDSRDLPLDVFVLDMDWHVKPAWGAYSWDQRLFPYPADAMSYLSDRGLHVAVNLHDNNGVVNSEVTFDEFAAYMGLPNTLSEIPFSMVNKTYVYGLQDIVLGNVVKDGVSFWWTDWQQGGQQGGCAGGKQNPTIWLNKQRGTEHLRRGENIRGLNLARFGGLGSHRYQVGFSGDVLLPTWETLAFQPYFSVTASNVGFGFWSHDMVSPNSYDYEQFVRWIQWGSFSAVMRSHDRGMSAGLCADMNLCNIVRVWEVPNKYFEANRLALQLRASLLPYIYTTYRQAYDTGLSPLRPMYYDFPESDEAYTAATPDGSMAQFMFGDTLLVAPIVTAANNTTSLASKTIWLPPGQWFEITTSMVYQSTGSVMVSKDYDLTEIPMFVPAGSVVPMRDLTSYIGTAMQPYNDLAFAIFPGATSGSGAAYEDDGMSVDYVTGTYAWTNCTYTQSGSTTLVTITTSGDLSVVPASRVYSVLLVSAMPPDSVVGNGMTLPYCRFGGLNCWMYDGERLATVITLSNVNVQTGMKVVVTAVQVPNQLSLFSGVKGAMYRAVLAKRNLDEDRSTPGSNDNTSGALMLAASTPDALGYLSYPNLTAFAHTLVGYRDQHAAALAEIQSMMPLSPSRLRYSVALLESAFQ